MRELGTNLYPSQFYHDVGIQWAIYGSLWLFNRAQLLIARLKESENPRMVLMKKLKTSGFNFQPKFSRLYILPQNRRENSRLIPLDGKF